VWTQQLIQRLRLELPRWQWTPRLTHRGGTIEGETQKQSLRISIKYARRHWTASVEGLLGRRQPQWVLTIEDAEFTSLDELFEMILAECM
jgi:hypothetical protein